MIFRPIYYPDDPYSNDASKLIFGELHNNSTIYKNPEAVLGEVMENKLNYCVENGTELLAVGSVYPGYFNQGIAMIESVVVRGQSRGEGIGRLLIENILETLRKIDSVEKVVLKSSGTAIGFYRKLGFTSIYGELSPKRMSIDLRSF